MTYAAQDSIIKRVIIPSILLFSRRNWSYLGNRFKNPQSLCKVQIRQDGRQALLFQMSSLLINNKSSNIYYH
ncbi:hypothetical protein RclHR1_01270010 [Rhizophagus clarus]|uniref:Uncharacterized protein n=1 Tax=Rhizophagus clarus TaxID=94130 RepID=A0A2Z6QMW6_9GLOM|nr:hypothetical protein RclHR1_01270010 [Rhizophagus clarus]